MNIEECENKIMFFRLQNYPDRDKKAYRFVKWDLNNTYMQIDLNSPEVYCNLNLYSKVHLKATNGSKLIEN